MSCNGFVTRSDFARCVYCYWGDIHTTSNISLNLTYRVVRGLQGNSPRLFLAVPPSDARLLTISVYHVNNYEKRARALKPERCCVKPEHTTNKTRAFIFVYRVCALQARRAFERRWRECWCWVRGALFAELVRARAPNRTPTWVERRCPACVLARGSCRRAQTRAGSFVTVASAAAAARAARRKTRNWRLSRQIRPTPIRSMELRPFDASCCRWCTSSQLCCRRDSPRPSRSFGFASRCAVAIGG